MSYVVATVLLSLVVIWYFCYLKRDLCGVVVGKIDNGWLVKLSRGGQLVYISSGIVLVIGDKVSLGLPINSGISYHDTIADLEHTVHGGRATPDGHGRAILVRPVDNHRWLAKEGNSDVLLELDDDTHKVGDSVNFVRLTIVLKQYYLISYYHG